jgi:hypothetical protein
MMIRIVRFDRLGIGADYGHQPLDPALVSVGSESQSIDPNEENEPQINADGR